MPTSGIRIVNEANLHSYYPTSALVGKGDILVEELNVPVTLNQNSILLENIEPAGKTFVNLDTKSHWGGGYSTIVTAAPNHMTAEMPVFAEIQSNSQHQLGGRRGGGRRSAIKLEELSPEEEERVRVRRERNKLAAARCRKRRVDQTETLQSEVDDEEERKRQLQEEIHSLQSQREELQFILQAHKEVCNRTPPSILPNTSPAYHIPTSLAVTASPPVASRSLPLYAPPLPLPSTTLATRSVALNVPKVIVKSEVPDMEHYQVLLTHEEAANLEQSKPSSPKRARPATLSLAIKPQCLRSIEGIPIETPTNVFSSLNFDALMDGRTGLTPTNVLTPVSITMSSSLQTPVAQVSTPNTCATQQQRSHHATTPDTHKLVAL